MPSTVIRSFSYDAEARELEVLFTAGRCYIYFNVPPEVANGMRKAFAKGEFFNQEIRGRYRFAETN